VPPEATLVGRRDTPPLFGLGLIEAIPELQIRLVAGRRQRDDVSGRYNSANGRVGRFGWKAQIATVHDFAIEAYRDEMGITTPFAATENAPQGGPVQCDAEPDAEDDGQAIRGPALPHRAAVRTGGCIGPRERGRGEETAYEASFLRALDLTVRAAAAKGTPLGLCGEVAGAPAFTALLIGLGIRELSMSPERLAEVRYNVLGISAAEARTVAQRALAASSASDVKRLLSEHSDPWHELLRCHGRE
jgi:hypothetical protein